ncbi:MAG: pyridoxal phosphate-dependent aminotransferase [Candidatus Pristimantibacillus lignocellulolyticus]|uniref:cysteine-S-conjugate beta-lyase n=1 Tax=Candidatus Pristimantibacillus lignocellulolyticus TaxID=2994561 RepID=A0A9J6Z995_9BACL|nr:MAG: pyridoxal phosphate-dependent aminotransferase [Candidatus Pristimantibacillus lignocellulolyticus]
MTYNFDELIDRRNTRSYKWDQVGPLFGDTSILPLWVADMDFYSPPAVRKVLQQRTDIGIYGYSIKNKQYFEAITSWFERRHHWTIQPSWIVDVPSVVTTLSLSVDLYTKPGDGVVLQSPVYYPFYDVIEGNNRKVVRNPLRIEDGRYEMDFEHLEQLFKDGAKLMLLCNPHNPGGRVWERSELEKLAKLAIQYDVIVVSDEIHCDLTFEGHPHTPFASLSEEAANITITALAATKTFNIPGLHTSFAVISNPELREIFDKRVKILSIHMANHFAQDAVQAAYNEGEQWLDELIVYVKANLDYAVEYLAEHAPIIKPLESQGTYLLWLDCRAISEDPAVLKELMYKKAKVAFNEGSTYGVEGSGWLRVNLACPRSILEQALKQFVDAINN